MEQIDSLISFFENQVEVVNALSYPSKEADVTLYKKIAYVSMLDCFSGLRFHKAAYPELHKKNKMRFTRFLEECANWDVGCLISLTFLNNRLSKKSSDGSLAKHVNNKLATLGNDFGGTIDAKSVDESPKQLLALASTEIEEKTILSCQHYSILYNYRNNLVHQARRPGGAAEFMGQGKIEACYHNYVHNSAIYLLYPLGLFKRLCSNSLENLKNYFEENSIDPQKLEDDPRCF